DLLADSGLDVAPELGRRRAGTPPGPSASVDADLLVLGGVALDRRERRAADADLDLLGLRLLRLRDVHLEDAVRVVRGDLMLAHARGQADRPRERAVAALEAVDLVLRELLRALALGADRQRAVLELDRDLVLGDARQVERV